MRANRAAMKAATVLWIALLCIAVGAVSGCATYSLPVARLDTPEAAGKGRVGRFEVGAHAAPSLSGTPVAVTNEETGVTTNELQTDFTNFLFGFTASLKNELDVGVRLQPGAPITFKGKYQLIGSPEMQSKAGNFSFSFTGAIGFLATGGTANTTFFTFDLGALAGYRLFDRHLIWVGPYVTLGSIGGSNTGITPGSPTNVGFSVGYQYTLNKVFYFRGEFALASGTFLTSSISGWYPAFMAGINL